MNALTLFESSELYFDGWIFGRMFIITYEFEYRKNLLRLK